MGKRRPPTCVVLVYHWIPAEQRERFARQMDILCRLGTPLRADNTAPLAPSQQYVSVTFDDGLISFAENALPELEKRNIPAVLFAVTGMLGSVPAWKNYSRKCREALDRERTLTGEQLREISQKVLIGSHSITHPMLTELDEAEAKREIVESKRQLEALLGYPITTFCFPYGDFSEDLLRYCRDGGYERVFSVLPVTAFSDPREFLTGRVPVDPKDWPIEFWLKASGAYRWRAPLDDVRMRRARFKRTQKAERMTPNKS